MGQCLTALSTICMAADGGICLDTTALPGGALTSVESTVE